MRKFFKVLLYSIVCVLGLVSVMGYIVLIGYVGQSGHPCIATAMAIFALLVMFGTMLWNTIDD